MTFKGIVKSRIVSARFAASGKIVSVNKRAGDVVKKGELIASLSRKVLQTELDRELADFEKVRADFEIFAQKYPDPTETIDKYLKTEKQAALNASVKEVELAKAKLDDCDLFSPVDGTIMDDSNIAPGIYITPAGSEVRIIDSGSFFAEIRIEQKEIKEFEKTRDAKVKIAGFNLELTGKTSPVYSDGKEFFIKIPVADKNLLPGLSAEIDF